MTAPEKGKGVPVCEDVNNVTAGERSDGKKRVGREV